MTKKIIKNILLSFVIIYTILNLIGFVITEIGRRQTINEFTIEMREENMTWEKYMKYEENAQSLIENNKKTFRDEERDIPVPATYTVIVQSYIMGANHILEIQLFVFICSIGLSITIGIIISLEEKSKTKHILLFILLGLILNTVWTFKMGVSNDRFFGSFFENFLDNIRYSGVYYILLFIALYLGKYFVNKKRANKLNEELKNIQK